MPSTPQPPKRSWRDDAPGSGGGANKREWQKEPGAAKRGPWFSKRIKILLAGMALLTVVGGVVALWLMPRNPDPPRLVLISAGYETNLAVPHNVYGKRSLGDFKQWADEHNKNHGGDREHSIDVHQEELTTDGDPFAKSLKDCNSNSVVVFVAVHGGGSASRGAYLIRNNASPREDSGPYQMDKALAALRLLPNNTKKLLILDTTQVNADWNLGMLHNDFVRTLSNDPGLKTIPNLVVLFASDENQRSWVSEDFGRTIFAHFVTEGLNGAAKQNDNGMLTAQELIEYVQQQVESWVRHNRGAVQTPRVLDPNNVAKGMELVAVERSAYKETEADPAKTTAFTPPPELLAAWEQRDKLANSFPHPATYTPHWWRQYHDALLRYEQLLRAGDSENARTMEQELSKLVSSIKQGQHLDYDALAATLATPTALGWALPEDLESQLRQEFTSVWNGGKPEEFVALLKTWQTAVGDRSLKNLRRIFLVTLLLERASASEADFQRVCAILPRIDDELPPRRPAEAHFALMMKEFVPDSNHDWKRMRACLSARIHAEQAALGLPRTDDETRLPKSFTPYSEQLPPWIRKDVENADIARRLREDLLFASPKEFARLGGKLVDADGEYEKIQKRAAQVRSAFQLRDRVLADLPYYSQWLARQALPEDEEKRILDTWDAVQELCRLLDAPAPDKIEALKEPAKKIRFDDLAQRFKKAYEVDDVSRTQQNWRRLHELLSVPLIPAKTRMDLLALETAVSRDLNIGAKKAETLTGVNEEQTDRGAQSAAQRQGRFALHMLGNDHPVYKEVEAIVAKPEGDWQKNLDRAGEQLGEAFTKIAVKLYSDTDKGRKAPLDEAAPLLHDAAMRVRLTSGAAVAAWSADDPVGEDRNVRMCELMKWQGERTFADYWAAYPGADDLRNPYFRFAGQLYVDAAKSLAGNDKPDLEPAQKTARLAGLTKLEADLAADDKLELRWRDGDTWKAGAAILNITDENKVQRDFSLVSRPTTPDGLPIVWEEKAKSLKPASDADLERHALDRIPKKVEEGRFEFTLKPEEPMTRTFDKEKTQYIVKGFYRGRQFSLDTAVTLHYLPELVSYNPELSNTARIAVQASKGDYDRFAAANSEIVIVVDYSGSMKSIVKNTGKSRKDIALDALEACLKKIPNGVKVTLLTFSAETDGDQVTPQFRQVEWDNSIGAVNTRMKQLRSLVPHANTPLVRATIEARDCFTEGFKGAKTLVILTDGGDNTFDGRGQDYKKETALREKYGATMDKCLKNAFQDSRVLINVVGFRLSELDPKEDKAEIEGLKRYQPAIEKIGGEFKNAEDSTQLAEQLERFILQIHYKIDEESGHVPEGALPDEGADVSRSQSNNRWIRGLSPGTYKIVLQANRLQKAFEQRVRVERGDSLVLQLVPAADGKTFQFRRETYVDSFTVKNLNRTIVRREVEDTSWLFSVLQNQQVKNQFTREAVQMMAVLEKRDDKPASNKTAVQQIRPQHVWFQVTTEGKPTQPVPGLRFYPLADYPAPCYSLDIPKWESPGTKARLEVWWSEDQIPDCGILRRTTGTKVAELAPRSMEVRPTDQDEQTRIVVESIQQEQRRVEVKPGVWQEDVDCLVVRLRYPVGEDTKPFFARLPEDVGDGSEHRFYTEAGKYTGIFWNVSKEKADKLEYIKIYSVKGVLRKGHHLDPMPLGAPNSNDRPQKPPE